jgi:U3 small nucleolar RNA-associated protein 21
MKLDKRYVSLFLSLRFTEEDQMSRFTNPLGTTLTSILVFGSQTLALTADGRHLLVWDAESGEVISTIIFEDGFTATNVIHPATLLNKVLVSSSEGSMQLWNIRTRYGKLDSSFYTSNK